MVEKGGLAKRPPTPVEGRKGGRGRWRAPCGGATYGAHNMQGEIPAVLGELSALRVLDLKQTRATRFYTRCSIRPEKLGGIEPAHDQHNG